MAVRLDAEAVEQGVGAEAFRAGEELVAAGRLGELAALGGGACATVHSAGDGLREVWVGIVDGAFESDCDCGQAEEDDLCVHAVAVTIAAVREGFPWSSAACPPERLIDGSLWTEEFDDDPEDGLSDPDPGGELAGVPAGGSGGHAGGPDGPRIVRQRPAPPGDALPREVSARAGG